MNVSYVLINHLEKLERGGNVVDIHTSFLKALANAVERKKESPKHSLLEEALGWESIVDVWNEIVNKAAKDKGSFLALSMAYQAFQRTALNKFFRENVATKIIGLAQESIGKWHNRADKVADVLCAVYYSDIHPIICADVALAIGMLVQGYASGNLKKAYPHMAKEIINRVSGKQNAKKRSENKLVKLGQSPIRNFTQSDVFQYRNLISQRDELEKIIGKKMDAVAEGVGAASLAVDLHKMTKQLEQLKDKIEAVKAVHEASNRKGKTIPIEDAWELLRGALAEIEDSILQDAQTKQTISKKELSNNSIICSGHRNLKEALGAFKVYDKDTGISGRERYSRRPTF